ncbi:MULTISPECIES: ABC transporter ATP-binding protein [Helicobacter]|uniref:ABC transporter ATP-binding protein n=1 Tax=Helicobacter ibis TaxID=2962633 RepID=A0ABT4VCN3_9HELI|nr:MULTISPECIES: ABC transporter ATP-binding protein [Helicobacter]MDA3966764.1 ABC transporter ATP-binding protein [Helicobacter sp. WB40]MDA3968454.1 ABC transporter ATP-binding protein [Helicobacter ibis]
MAILKINNIYKSFGKTDVLNGVNLSLEHGEIISILGESGCGKSSFLGAISGFFSIDGGEIYIKDCLVSSKDRCISPQNRNVGILFQDYALFPHLSVRDNICFGILQLTKQEQKKRLDEVIDILQISSLLDRYPNELSGGQAQRVALARTIVFRPTIILFDEPFSNLNHTLSVQMRRDIKAIIRDHNLSAIFVTHDKDDAFFLSDNIALMKNGKIIDTGSPNTLYHNPKTMEVALFLGNASFIHNCENMPYELVKFLEKKNFIVRTCDFCLSTSKTDIPVEVIESVFYGDYYEITLNLFGNIISINSSKDVKSGEILYLKLAN